MSRVCASWEWVLRRARATSRVGMGCGCRPWRMFPSRFSRLRVSVTRAGSAAEACIRAGCAHDGIVGHGQVGLNQFFDRNVVRGSCRSSSSQPGRVRVSRCCGLREASDLSVAQAVVDEREDLAGQRDACLVSAATLGELVIVDGEVRAAVVAADALDQGGTH